MHFVINRADLVLEGTHDEIVVPVSLVLDDGSVVPAGQEIVSDAEATALARERAARRPDESIDAYEQRVTALVTWSQEHVAQLVERRRGVFTGVREPAKLVIAPPVEAASPVPESTNGQQDDGQQGSAQTA